MQERRRYVRLNIALEITYSLPGAAEIQYKTFTKDISPNGARFTIEKEMPKGSVVDLKIKIPTADQIIPVKAKIVWFRKDSQADKNTYDCGLEFISIPQDSTTIFFQYLCSLMYEQLKELK